MSRRKPKICKECKTALDSDGICPKCLEDYMRSLEIEQARERHCPHGKLGNCEACNILGDLAFDSAREDRIFGR
jgi:hypothetical protein